MREKEKKRICPESSLPTTESFTLKKKKRTTLTVARRAQKWVFKADIASETRNVLILTVVLYCCIVLLYYTDLIFFYFAGGKLSSPHN